MAEKHNPESGNILFIILLAVALIGALTVAIQGSSQQTGNIDRETLIIKTSEIQRYAGEMARGIAFIMQNGHSEADIRFSHPDADTDYGDLSADSDRSDQLFDRTGGAVHYRQPPSDLNDGSAWEFYGHTALPDVGSDEADLIAVLPNVTEEFCVYVNGALGYDTATQPADTGTCVNGGDSERFDNGTQFSSSPNTVTDATFTFRPSSQGCVQCGTDFHYFYVLMAR
ncbi:MAG: hypothetical protein GC137_04080 [Alphaproteobacteria bacterium]|nr:hypothetical protein [Alphaproteobacteria bacterium]